ncbi:hypothetical protein ACS0TY_011671 [Phlomoides rotata]
MGSSKMSFLSALILLLAVSSSAKTFPCSSAGTTCDALIDYLSPNATTISAVKTLFNIKNLRTILGANNLPLSTPRNYSIPANSTIKIPFPCICRNGTGISNRRPNYTVVPGDGLYHIAAEVFSGLVLYPEIQAVNNISDADLIEVGQNLWIPLPCSCDRVEGQPVVHYGHRVAGGSSLEGIAAQYNVSQATLSTLNNLPNPPTPLVAGDVIDVPLRACSSRVSNTSLDFPLLVASDTYIFTANSCVRCKCDAALNWMLQCEPFGLNSSCTPIRCEGSENLHLGNTTTSGCNSTTCAYAGYNRTASVLTTLATDSTCPAPRSSATRLQGWRWNGVVIFMHIMVLCISFHKG